MDGGNCSRVGTGRGAGQIFVEWMNECICEQTGFLGSSVLPDGPTWPDVSVRRFRALGPEAAHGVLRLPSKEGLGALRGLSGCAVFAFWRGRGVTPAWCGVLGLQVAATSCR